MKKIIPVLLFAQIMFISQSFAVPDGTGTEVFDSESATPTTTSVLRLKSSAGESNIFVGSADPTGVVAGSIGDIVIDTTGTGGLYFNVSGGAGGWNTVTTGSSGTTLQSAYTSDVDGSNTTITLSNLDDSVVISNPPAAGTDSTFAFQINQNAAGVAALDIVTAATTANGTNITANNLTTGNALSVASSSTAVTSTDLLNINFSGAPAASWTGDKASKEITGNNANIDGNALKVGVTTSSTAGSASTALNVTTAGPTGAFALRVNDDGTYADATPLVVDDTGNVGIGTTTPTSKLHVIGGANDGTPNVEGIQIGDDSVNYAIEITNSGGTPYIDFQNDLTGIDFDARIILAGDDAMGIDGTSLGVGDTSPDGKLDTTAGAADNLVAMVIDQLDSDQFALDINASNVGTNVVDIASTTLTTGDVININPSVLTTGNLIQATLTDTVNTDVALFNTVGTALNTATNLTLNEISTTPANDVDITAVKVERGANDARMTYDEGEDRWKLDGGVGEGLKDIPVVLDRDVTLATVTSLGYTSAYSFSVPANVMGTNRTLRLTAIGDYINNSGLTRTLGVRVQFGGTTFYDDTSAAMASSATRRPFRISFEISNLGATNSQFMAGNVHLGNVGAATTGINDLATAEWNDVLDHVFAVNGTRAVDTTAAATLDLAFSHSAAGAAGTLDIRIYSVLLELV